MKKAVIRLRTCKRCGKYHRTTAKFSKYCLKCYKEKSQRSQIKKEEK